MPLPGGTRLGPYEILALIGAGGMGEVYQARDSRINGLVALKILSPERMVNPERRRGEFRSAARILRGVLNQIRSSLAPWGPGILNSGSSGLDKERPQAGETGENACPTKSTPAFGHNRDLHV